MKSAAVWRFIRALLPELPETTRSSIFVRDDPEAEVLRQEVDRLEEEIEELTEFSPGSAFADSAE